MNSKVNEEILFCLEELKKRHYPASNVVQGLHNYNAIISKDSKELEAIYHLTQLHSVVLRNKTVLRFRKLRTNESETVPKLKSEDILEFKCMNRPIEENIQEMLKQIEEMPKEWTIVQLTPQFDHVDYLNEVANIYHTFPLNITVFKCGKNQSKPFVIEVDAPKDPVTGKTVELQQEVRSIMKGNIGALSFLQKRKKFQNQAQKLAYFSKRSHIEDRLKNLIKDIQNMWLKEWRCLFLGKFCDENLDKQIQDSLCDFFSNTFPDLQLTEKTLEILSALVKSNAHIKLVEMKRALQYLFPQLTDKNTLKNIITNISSIYENVLTGVESRTHPVILVLHDTLDCFPWEMLDVLKDQPICRLPSLHFVYSMFKEHESNIKDGHVIVTEHEKGTYIVNPDEDLKYMQVRMMTFFQYWLPDWIGTVGYQPETSEFFEMLTSSSIFSYNGHGSGSHLVSLDKIQKAHIKAVILLFGCGSTKLNRMDPQIEMTGTYHAYLIARCPCVVGMLWEVTDMDTDTLSTDFLSYWLPSKAEVHWKYVEKEKWKKAEADLQFKGRTTAVDEETLWQPELLRALAMAKATLKYTVTKAGCVVRGLPVKLEKT